MNGDVAVFLNMLFRVRSPGASSSSSSLDSSPSATNCLARTCGEAFVVAMESAIEVMRLSMAYDPWPKVGEERPSLAVVDDVELAFVAVDCFRFMVTVLALIGTPLPMGDSGDGPGFLTLMPSLDEGILTSTGRGVNGPLAGESGPTKRFMSIVGTGGVGGNMGEEAALPLF